MADYKWKDGEKGMGTRKIKVAKAPPSLKTIAARKKTQAKKNKSSGREATASKAKAAPNRKRASAAPKSAPKATPKKRVSTAPKPSTAKRKTTSTAKKRTSSVDKSDNSKARRGTGRTGSISAPKKKKTESIFSQAKKWLDRQTKGGHSAKNSVRKKAGMTGKVRKGPSAGRK